MVACCTAAVATSTIRAVSRTCCPSRWKPPLTTHRAPRVRPACTAGVSLRSTAVPASTRAARRAASTASFPTTETVPSPARSAVMVSAMPNPIQSSSAAPVMLANATTATVSPAAPGGANWA